MTDPSIDAKIKSRGYDAFVVKKETPNYYQLEDGTILRVYPILNSVVLDKINTNAMNVSANIQNVVAAYVPAKLRDEKTTTIVSLEEALKNLDKVDMKFDVINEHFNEYIIDKKWSLHLRTALAQVNRSKLKNNFGEPIYSINTSLVTKLKKKGGKV